MLSRVPRSVGWPLLGSLGLATASMLIVAPAPSYDPWMWLLWGREISSGELSTTEGPAFKPLAVAICALLAPLGSAAPWLWILLVRTSALLALWLAFTLARRLAGGSWVAGAIAAVAVGLCGAFPGYAASGQEPAPTLALALLGAEAWRRGWRGGALACAIGCALLRVEAWPFVLVLGLVLWRREPRLRPWLVGSAIAIPALWLGPELWGSGDALRSGSRARVPNPGQPALADVPALASLREAAALPLWPLWAGVVALALLVRRGAAPRQALAPAAAGLAWIAVVALMAQAGFSGEPRYALPGAALVGISGAVGLVLGWQAIVARWRAARGRAERRVGEPGEPAARARIAWSGVAGAVAVLALLAVATPRLIDLGDMRRSQAYQHGLAADLADAVRAAGGRDAVLRCGAPIVGNLRGPLMAYRLDVRKQLVDFVAQAPGTVFRSRLSPRRAAEPAVGPPFALQARAGRWAVFAACRESGEGGASAAR